MKDLFFKDLSDKVLSKHCGKKKAHPHSFSFLHRGCPTKDLPNNRNERKGYAYS